MSDTSPQKTDEELVQEIMGRYEEYHAKLRDEYWPNFMVNKQLYAGYDPKTPDKYQTNTARGQVESTVNRIMTSNRKVSTDVHGPIAAINRKIEKTIGSLANSIFDDRKLAKRHGTYRANKEKLVRDLLITGNAVAEMNYEYVTTEVEGKTRVEADGTYLSPVTYDQYVFNPAYSWNTSPEKFIHKTASFEWFKSQEMKEVEDTTEEQTETETEEKAEPKTVGVYKNLDKVEEIAAERGKLKTWNMDSNSYIPYSGTNHLANRWVEDLDVKVYWDGCHLIVIVEDSIIVRDEYDPFGTGTDNIRTAMLIEEQGRPVGWGLIDHIRGLVQIKDDSLNQRKALLERALKVGGLYDETDPAKLRMVAQVILRGGVAPGQGEKWKEINVINPGVANALLSPGEIQGEIERTSLFSPYASGQTSQATDKTQGTASGIATITQSAAPDLETLLEKVQEQIDTPFLDFALQVKANTSSETDIHWIMSAGGSNESVAITKRFLQGKPNAQDLVQAGIITQEEIGQYLPATPDAMNEPYIDDEWLITVTLDPSNASDKYQKAQAEKALVDEAIDRGVPMKVQDAYTAIAEKFGFDDFSTFVMSEEEQQQKQKAQEQAQQAAMQQQDQMAQADHRRKMELLQASHHHEVALAAATSDNTPPEMPQPTAAPEQPPHPVQKIAESMNFKDIPTEAQNAMLEMAGLPATAKPAPAPTPAIASKPQAVVK